MEYTKQIKKWDVFEYVCHGLEDGNPFVDHWIKGRFVHTKEAVEIDGFMMEMELTVFALCRLLKAYILSL